MPRNVSKALNRDTAVVVNVFRKRREGKYVDGLYQETAERCFKALASPQQPTAKDLKILPEGQRSAELMVFYVNKKLRVVDDRTNQQADTIKWDDKRWRVVAKGDWSTFGHQMVIAANESE